MDGELNGRVVGLERRVRQLTRCLIVMIIFIIAIIGIVNLRSAGSPHRLAITDRDGNEVAVLRAYGSLPGLSISKDDDGRLTTNLGEIKAEPNLRLFDENGNAALLLCYDQFGSRLSLRDPDANMGAVLKLTEDGPGLWLYLHTGEIGKGEVTSALLSLDDIGLRLWILDDRGKRGPSLRLAQDVNNKPCLELLDEHGKTVWSAQ